uniref:MAM domain-containing protein n=1 Tax=Plectus sambesii TaxID=2011161 RepID=A0A914X991_9BILA
MQDSKEFSTIRLLHFAFPCKKEVDFDVLKDWSRTLQAELIIPCLPSKQNSSINFQVDSPGSTPTVLYPPFECAPLRGLPQRDDFPERTFIQLPLSSLFTQQLKIVEPASLKIRVEQRYDDVIAGNGTDEEHQLEPFVRYSYTSGICEVKCNGGSEVMWRTPACRSGIICDFELEKCDWRFESPGLDHPDDPNVNFRIIGGNRDGAATHFAYFNSSASRKEPAMILSPYYQHTSAQCALKLKYRLFGQPGAAIEITTQHRSIDEEIDEVDYYDNNDWTRPTLHASFKAQSTYIDK